MTAIGASGRTILMDTFVRLTKSPVVSIAKIRGCARGVSSEFRPRPATCASRRAIEHESSAIPSLVSVCILAVEAQSACPIWLAAAGRSKSFSAPTTSIGDSAERYGYINRSLPDAELDGFVDALGAQDRHPSIDEPSPPRKNLVNQVSLPPPTGSSMPSLLLGQR